jgi:LmbE family N-acetylglucosaminyl deacetylase
MAGLLLVLAHPDDETFFAAGAIAKCAAGGVQVGVVCATRGERGATGEVCSIEDLPGVREAELRAAARVLGIHKTELLPYEDQKLSAAPPDDIRRQIVSAVRRARPQVAITFDPNGANLHPDHIAIGRFAMDAISAAADARWYPETGAAHTVERVLWPAPIPPFELGRKSDLGREAGIDFLIDIRMVGEVKRAALQAHRTQFPGLSKIFSTDDSLSWEAFRVGWGPRPGKVPAEDLFGA